MSEIKKLNIKKESLNINTSQIVTKSNRSFSGTFDLKTISQPTEYVDFKNEPYVSKENPSNEMSSNNQYEDFYQNEGELFEIWSMNRLNVNPIISYLSKSEKTQNNEPNNQKVFGNMVNRISIKIGSSRRFHVIY